ncbi:MAG: spore coat protein U domain-containing protein [Geobacteraceae bacterium]|nr:spore coat protein U domain-containing protein [Geobacteraceae bacterium]
MNILFRFIPAALLALLPAAAAAFHCDVSATHISFGAYDVFSPSPLDTTGTITVECNIKENEKRPMPVTVAISKGGSNSFFPRKMQRSGGGAPMNYNLYLDPSRSNIWGDGSNNTSVFTGNVVRNETKILTIYGRIPARQNLAAGPYSDSPVVVTVSW